MPYRPFDNHSALYIHVLTWSRSDRINRQTNQGNVSFSNIFYKKNGEQTRMHAHVHLSLNIVKSMFFLDGLMGVLFKVEIV